MTPRQKEHIEPKKHFLRKNIQKMPLAHSLESGSMTSFSEGYNTFSFTGKEKDSESDYYYFGARYFIPTLSIWNSVDPMAGKYPSLSPYNYCAWNPVKIVDPNGMDTIDIHLDKGCFVYTQADGNHVFRFYRNQKMLEDQTLSFPNSDNTKINIMEPYRSTVKSDGKDMLYLTQYLEFNSQTMGQMVFEKIAMLGADNNEESKEWDYHWIYNKGELSSSGAKDFIIHKADRYRDFSTWNHFHPQNNVDSYYPSESDQDKARKHPNSRCVIFSQGKQFEFGGYVPQQKDKYIDPAKYRKLWRTYAR